MKTPASFHPLTLVHAFEQFLEASSFARRTRESYTEDLAPLFAEVGQHPVRALTTDVLHWACGKGENNVRRSSGNRRFKALADEWTSEELGRFFWLTPEDMLQVGTCRGAANRLGFSLNLLLLLLLHCPLPPPHTRSACGT